MSNKLIYPHYFIDFFSCYHYNSLASRKKCKKYNNEREKVKGKGEKLQIVTFQPFTYSTFQ